MGNYKPYSENGCVCFREPKWWISFRCPFKTKTRRTIKHDTPRMEAWGRGRTQNARLQRVQPASCCLGWSGAAKTRRGPPHTRGEGTFHKSLYKRYITYRPLSIPGKSHQKKANLLGPSQAEKWFLSFWGSGLFSRISFVLHNYRAAFLRACWWCPFCW